MNAKLTLSLDKEVIQKAKQFASERGTSISRILEDYLRVVMSSERSYETRTSVVDDLVGIVEDPDTTVDYDTIRYEALKKKYNL